MQWVKLLNSWLARERSLSFSTRTQSITTMMSDQSLKSPSLSFGNEYNRKKTDSKMSGELERMISFIFVFKMKNLRKKLKPWDKVWCFWEKNSYRVIRSNKRFIIIAKPFYAIKNFIYSIIDLEEKRMWPDSNLFGWYNYLKKNDAQRAIRDLESWDLEISQRRGCELKSPDKIEKQKR